MTKRTRRHAKGGQPWLPFWYYTAGMTALSAILLAIAFIPNGYCLAPAMLFWFSAMLAALYLLRGLARVWQWSSARPGLEHYLLVYVILGGLCAALFFVVIIPYHQRIGTIRPGQEAPEGPAR
jgi:hypothetical protein